MNRYKNVREVFSNDIKISRKNKTIFYKNKEIEWIKDEVPSFLDTNTDALTSAVSNFYNRIQFPNYEGMETYSSIYDKGRGNEITRKIDDELGWTSKILELGCGTGQMSLFLGRGKRSIYAVDISPGSLSLGEAFRKRHRMENVYFMHMDVFDMCFKDDFFDCVISNGVLHHTKDAKKAFKLLAKVTKPQGYIIIGLYHKFGRFFTKLKQLTAKFIGENIYYFDKTSKGMGSEEKRKAWVQDQFFNPWETVHTPSEVLTWFEENNVELINIVPHIYSSEKPLFERQSVEQLSFIDDVMLLFNVQQIKEGGFFIMVGKKK